MDDMIIGTRCRFLPTPGSRGGSRRPVLKRAESSLRRLRVEAIDPHLVHGRNDEADVAETLEAPGNLCGQGALHHVRCSDLIGSLLERIRRTAEAHGLLVPCALPSQRSFLERGFEAEMLPRGPENRIGLTPWPGDGGPVGTTRPPAPRARRGWARTRIAASKPATDATPRAPTPCCAPRGRWRGGPAERSRVWRRPRRPPVRG